MDFGRLSEDKLGKIEFALPKEPTDNMRFHSNDRLTKIYVGCAKWGRKEWVGMIYPRGTKDKDYLTQYQQHFDCVEMNATHYRVFTKQTIEKWANAVGKEFKFCPKFTNSISHYRRLKDCRIDTLAFYDQIYNFGQNLGPAFLQLPDNFSPKTFEGLQSYVESLPTEVDIFLELRNKQWFEDQLIKSDLTSFLIDKRVGWVITDTAGRRDVMHLDLTIPKAFIRFVGNSLHPTDYPRMDNWVIKIKEWVDKGIDEIYFFMHMHDEGTTPILTKYFIDELNQHPKISLKVPKIIESDQIGLF